MATAAPLASPDTATNPTHLTQVSDLHPHPAQMRTVHTTATMAALTLQVLQAGGSADWQPIVATPRPDTDGYAMLDARLCGRERPHPGTGRTGRP